MPHKLKESFSPPPSPLVFFRVGESRRCAMLFKKVFSLCLANSSELQIEIARASNFQIKSLTRLFTFCYTSTLPVLLPSTRIFKVFSMIFWSRSSSALFLPDRAPFDGLILRYETTFYFPVRFRKIKRFLFFNLSLSLFLVLERKLVPSKLANRDLNESHGESITSTPFDEGGRFREG